MEGLRPAVTGLLHEPDLEYDLSQRYRPRRIYGNVRRSRDLNAASELMILGSC